MMDDLWLLRFLHIFTDRAIWLALCDVISVSLCVFHGIGLYIPDVRMTRERGQSLGVTCLSASSEVVFDTPTLRKYCTVLVLAFAVCFFLLAPSLTWIQTWTPRLRALFPRFSLSNGARPPIGSSQQAMVGGCSALVLAPRKKLSDGLAFINPI